MACPRFPVSWPRTRSSSSLFSQRLLHVIHAFVFQVVPVMPPAVEYMLMEPCNFSAYSCGHWRKLTCGLHGPSHGCFLMTRSRSSLVLIMDFHDLKKDRCGISAENVYFWIGADQAIFPALLHSVKAICYFCCSLLVL